MKRSARVVAIAFATNEEINNFCKNYKPRIKKAGLYRLLHIHSVFSKVSP
jgi:hypothetical protein